MDYTLNLFLFVLVLFICIYYLNKIRECGQKYKELKNSMTLTVNNNNELNERIKLLANDVDSMDTVETYVNYNSKENEILSYNRSLNLNPNCSIDNPSRRQGLYTEVVGDNCSLKTKPPTPQPIVNPDQNIDKSINCNIKKAENHLKQSIQAMEVIHRQQQNRRCKANQTSQPVQKEDDVNALNFPLISPCYDAYKRCIQARSNNNNNNNNNIRRCSLERDLDLSSCNQNPKRHYVDINVNNNHSHVLY